MTTGTAAVEIQVEAESPAQRRREPVTCGLPWPRGAVPADTRLAMTDGEGRPVPLQVRTLDRWPDGSVRWALLDWQATVQGRASFFVQTSRGEPSAGPDGLTVTEQAGQLTIETGAARFQLGRNGSFPFASVVAGDDSPRAAFEVRDETGQVFQPRTERLHVEERGPVRACALLEGVLAHPDRSPLGEFSAELHFFAGSAAVRFVLTLRNPRPAGHPGGMWDLGQAGSVYLKDAAFTVTLPAGDGPAEVRCSPRPPLPLEPFPTPFELYQDSSGGENWRSSNHVNRQRQVRTRFRGYRLRAGGERGGHRATPVVVLERGGQQVAVAMQHFWQNFPKAVEASDEQLVLRLFPHQFDDVHELQGGEQKTHTFTAAFGPDAVTDVPLDWCRNPLLPHAGPAWYAASGAVPYLTPWDRDPNEDYKRLVAAAVEGEDTFFHKREVIDEYGWRHFGEVYADHETVFHRGPAPLVSHYNNQYDPVAGLTYQFLRTGDARWWALADELAGHVMDIDVYHTGGDKAAYNGGLFWHTCHYVDADTATHRSYPRAAGVCGGGPGNEHNYTTGLLLHHFLTGSPQSRHAVLGLANWVLDMDDGARTVFRWLDRGDTGLASATVSPGYHGPGRGAGNSINALLDGYRLSGDERYRNKLEQLVRRCVHPADDVAGRNLLDAERRWSYTVFFQALGRYLDGLIEQGQLGPPYAYARASLLHYARWMAEHEAPTLDRPERLQYPTETWAAQDMRKSEVFKYAAKHAAGDERGRFLERAEFLFRTSTKTLLGMKTRTLARPVIVLLSNGLMHAYFQQHPDTTAPAPAHVQDFGRPQRFVPQKARVKKKLAALAAAGTAAVLAGLLYLWRG